MSNDLEYRLANLPSGRDSNGKAIVARLSCKFKHKYHQRKFYSESRTRFVRVQSSLLDGRKRIHVCMDEGTYGQVMHITMHNLTNWIYEPNPNATRVIPIWTQTCYYYKELLAQNTLM